MTRFILLTFVFLFWAFYEMSGGAGFQPGTASREIADDIPEPAVTRADTGMVDLTRLTPPTPLPDVALATARAAPVAAPVPPTAPAEPAAAPAPAEAPAREIWQVTGARVNLRAGPGTRYQVVTQLRRGDGVTILSDPGGGWVELRAVEGDRVGWMSANFLALAAD
ncbi:SH3 domain-containing protein [Aestuariicoccus sp. MJ-SS9]|uniref:SH3 domain-containing protein n=1 Tax=Aestuariicoccus sp. MJ-SS9 TaxID=3079855 RepID=UPI00291546D9|nr:SH3 domain-containing protein [Aestuariicoccus sp. MJ-SS9]MDU8909647.1 SH3 domain-containing protein [Aestuariicoccus sp. MJ-SS9]